MAWAMTPLSSVSIAVERTEASGELACVYGRVVLGQRASSERGSDHRRPFPHRLALGADGAWRVSLELLNAGSESPS